MTDFDTPIDRFDTHSMKWDQMEARYGVPDEDGIAMWVADMDFRPPEAVGHALRKAVDHGVFGYFGDDSRYRAAVAGWMRRRHGWEVDPAHVLSSHGLVAAVALCLQSLTEPGDGIILFTPVYHAFARTIHTNGRIVVEAPLVMQDGRYAMDLAGLAASLTGRERMVILCSPHNPGGRIWEPAELRALADFCTAHDLLLVSDEIHHDLLMPGETHTPFPCAAPEAMDRTVMLTAGSKTFNLAGGMTGNLIVPDAGLRARLKAKLGADGVSHNTFGVLMNTAAYEEGDAWLDALRAYLAENARVFDEGIHAIPGLRSMKLQSTYLAWVDFSGTGMEPGEIIRRVENTARIAASHGATFGAGGESFLRFNIGTQRARIYEAVARLRSAFSDLQ